MFQLLLILAISGQILGQDNFFFPDQMPSTQEKVPNRNQGFATSLPVGASASTAQLLEVATPLNTSQLSNIKGTEMYDKIVDDIIANGIFKTALAINKEILQSPGGSRNNIVFAPVSITAALALVLLGSNGKTFDEITNLMGLATGVLDIRQKSETVHKEFGRMIQKVENNAGIVIGKQATFASAIFVQDNFPIRSVYKQTAEAIYQSEVLNMDFRANSEYSKKIINAWVSDRTNGKIQNIIQQLSPATNVVIVSAMYFKAEWEKKFFVGATTRRPFFSNGRNAPATTYVDMMANGGFFPYYRDLRLGCEIMGFPYKGGHTVMYVLMPFNSTTEILKQFEEKITAEELNRLADETDDFDAVITLPKMKLESTIDLRTPLEALGVKSLFTPGSANLALLSPGARGAIPNVPLPGNRLVTNPIAVEKVSQQDNDVLIFSRTGIPKNCTEIFDNKSSVNTCVESPNIAEPLSKTPVKLNTRTFEQVETLDSIRNHINQQSTDNNFQNPGLYADQVIHKVFMDITEKGTEGAAATSVALTRTGSRVTFRVDAPFLFFIRHEETKTVLFWGSVVSPTPSFEN